MRNLPSLTKEFELRELFKAFGTIVKVNVVGGKSASAAHAFMDFDTIEATKKVLSCKQKFTLREKNLLVEEKFGGARHNNNSSYRPQGRGSGQHQHHSGRGQGNPLMRKGNVNANANQTASTPPVTSHAASQKKTNPPASRKGPSTSVTSD